MMLFAEITTWQDVAFVAVVMFGVVLIFLIMAWGERGKR